MRLLVEDGLRKHEAGDLALWGILNYDELVLAHLVPKGAGAFVLGHLPSLFSFEHGRYSDNLQCSYIWLHNWLAEVRRLFVLRYEV